MNKKITNYKCSFCNNMAVWMLMSGNDIEKDCFCDNCVPRGCSCNSDDFFFGEGHYQKEEQINEKLKIGKLKVLNYGNKIQIRGKHLEEITDMNLIKNMFYNFTEEQLTHLEIIPLNNKGEEFPCCEYDYFKDGIEILNGNEE